MKDLSTVYYINSHFPSAAQELGIQLRQLFSEHFPNSPTPVILCIGTDRVTGDSLGPMTGTFLKAYERNGRIPIYGTLDCPIHALNLKESWKQIKKKHPRNPIIAIDASLGTKKHLGYLTLGCGSLQPGAGVQKELLCVGDFFITGIINTAVPEAQLALQNTRLAAVTDMACCITHGILYAFHPYALIAASYS